MGCEWISFDREIKKCIFVFKRFKRLIRSNIRDLEKWSYLLTQHSDEPIFYLSVLIRNRCNF